MPYSASLIAYVFVKKGIEESKPVSQMKLQKMVFFAHGYHLAKYGKPLLNEEFEAWKFGPVVPSIYQSYKLYGSDKITDPRLILGLYNKKLDLTDLDTKAIEAINYTWEVTKNVSASNLSLWSHKQGSPWQKVYQPSLSVKIPNKEIETYFTEILSETA